MLFKYKGVTKEGRVIAGEVEANSDAVALGALQKRGLLVSELEPAGRDWTTKITLWRGVSGQEVVMLSRQMATLFSAQVSALRVFRLLAEEVDNVSLRQILNEIADDIRDGSQISVALSKHPQVFSDFYVAMVQTGEESGRLDEVLEHLADYLDRTYELTSKAKHALIYPAVVIVVFLAVMLMMFTVFIPQIAEVILDAGQELPIFTQIILWISDFLLTYGLWLAAGVIVGATVLVRWVQTHGGRQTFDRFLIEIPYLGDLFRKLYLARIADNLNTMISSGISIIRSLEVTADVVGNSVYRQILEDTQSQVAAGRTIAEALADHEEIPAVMVQMSRVGEETGSLGSILKTLADFYRQEFSTAVDTVIGLIEPVLIVVIGVGVGLLLASILMPIYNLTGAMV